jgi:hypothetical protein
MGLPGKGHELTVERACVRMVARWPGGTRLPARRRRGTSVWEGEAGATRDVPGTAALRPVIDRFRMKFHVTLGSWVMFRQDLLGVC